MEWTEHKLQDAIESDVAGKGHSCVVPNIFLPGFRNESDLVSITRTRYLWEYEIKITKTDFYADRRKDRHHNYPDPTFPNHKKANRFWYVMPGTIKDGEYETLIKADLVPPYAGLIMVYEEKGTHIPRGEQTIWAKEIKRAPLLHKDTVTIDQVMKIADVARWRMWDMRLKMDYIKQESEASK